MSRMSQKWRGEFISQAGRYGIRYEDAARALRIGATMQRLAEASCNGDWPADHGSAWETKECPECCSGWHPSSFRKGICPSCRIDQRAREFAASLGWTAELQGDPRGAVFKLVKEVDGRKVELVAA